MDRETKTLKTPAGKDLVVKARASVRERNQLRGVLLKNSKLDGEAAAAGEVKISEIAGAATDEVERLAIQLFVVSYDGKTDGVADMLLDSEDGKEYDFVVAEASKALAGAFTPAK